MWTDHFQSWSLEIIHSITTNKSCFCSISTNIWRHNAPKIAFIQCCRYLRTRGATRAWSRGCGTRCSAARATAASRSRRWAVIGWQRVTWPRYAPLIGWRLITQPAPMFDLYGYFVAPERRGPPVTLFRGCFVLDLLSVNINIIIFCSVAFLFSISYKRRSANLTFSQDL